MSDFPLFQKVYSQGPIFITSDLGARVNDGCRRDEFLNVDGIHSIIW